MKSDPVNADGTTPAVALSYRHDKDAHAAAREKWPYVYRLRVDMAGGDDGRSAYMTGDADHLAAIGRSLYGEQWQAPLARDLGVNRESVRRWLNGSSPFGADHGIWFALRAVLENRRDRAEALLAQLPPATAAAPHARDRNSN